MNKWNKEMEKRRIDRLIFWLIDWPVKVSPFRPTTPKAGPSKRRKGSGVEGVEPEKKKRGRKKKKKDSDFESSESEGDISEGIFK